MLDFDVSNNINITQRPDPIPYNYRLSYKVAQICLLLKLSVIRGGASMTKIQMLSSALLSDKEAGRLIDLLRGRVWNYIVRYDPVVIRAMKYALYENLVIQQANEKYKLSKSGTELVNKIMDDKELMIREKSFLVNYGRQLDESIIQSLMVQWRYEDVENK